MGGGGHVAAGAQGINVLCSVLSVCHGHCVPVSRALPASWSHRHMSCLPPSLGFPRSNPSFNGQRPSAAGRVGRAGLGMPLGGSEAPSPSLPSFQVAEMRRTLTPANSPVSSPSKHGDRFIPSRAGANWSVNFHRINVRAPEGRGQGGRREGPLTLQPGTVPAYLCPTGKREVSQPEPESQGRHLR